MKLSIVVIIFSASLSIPSLLNASYIAGENPDQRPAGAPVKSDTEKKDNAWYGDALFGVTQPFPRSLKFLESQGDWYTPFSHPGMPGRYDLRGWQN